MPLSRQLLTSSHLRELDTAISELLALAPRAGHPAPIPQQYVGTTINNAAMLLTVPASALDGRARIPTPSEDSVWHSIMKAVHRTFLASLQAAVEGGLVHICDQLHLAVTSGARARATGLAERIRQKVDPSPIEGELRELARTGSNQPAFDDYLEPVLENCFASDDRRREWRRFFRAFSIVRNKASHFNPALNGHERQALAAGGMGAMVDVNGNLQINPRVYAQLSKLSLDFFDEAVQGLAADGPAAS